LAMSFNERVFAKRNSQQARKNQQQEAANGNGEPSRQQNFLNQGAPQCTTTALLRLLAEPTTSHSTPLLTRGWFPYNYGGSLTGCRFPIPTTPRQRLVAGIGLYLESSVSTGILVTFLPIPSGDIRAVLRKSRSAPQFQL
jgi:hypothetical protein